MFAQEKIAGVRRLVEAEDLARWAGPDWNWWWTVTSDSYAGEERVRSELQRAVRHLESESRGCIEYVGAMDETVRGFPHAHLVVRIARTARWLPAERFESEWQRSRLGGHSRIAPYDPTRGALAYIATKLIERQDRLIFKLRRRNSRILRGGVVG